MRSTLIFVFLASSIFVTSLRAEVNLKIKNFREIPLSLEYQTGVSRKESEIQAYYLSRVSQFPQLGRFSEISAPFILAQLNFSGLFCQPMVNSDSKLPTESRRAHRQVDFQKSPSQFDPDKIKYLISEYSEIFWLRPADTNEESILVDIFNDLKSDALSSSADTTQLLGQFCSAFGTSLEFLAQ